jgi:hypothetical protein
LPHACARRSTVQKDTYDVEAEAGMTIAAVKGLLQDKVNAEPAGMK